MNKVCIALTVFYCAFAAIGENVLKEIDFTKNSKAVDDNILGTKILKYSKGYYFYYLRLNNVNNGLEINIKAAARNGAKLGIIVSREPRPGKLEKVKQYWHIKFPANKLVTKSFKVDFSKDMKTLGGSYRVYLYRSNKKGELLLNNISVKEIDSRNHLQKQLNETYLGNNKSPMLKQHQFLFSVCIYDYLWVKYAKEEKLDFLELMDKQFAILSKHGVNTLSMTVSSKERFAQLLKLAEKHKFFLFLQLDFAYFSSKWTNEQMAKKAISAANFISKYKSNPNIISFSVKEEVALKDIKKLSEYYKLILKQEPEAPLQIILNYLNPAKQLPKPYPAYIGTDRYAFWYTHSGKGYLASPNFALNWIRNQSHRFYIEAAKRNAEFFLVATVNATLSPYTIRQYCVKDDFDKYISGKTAKVKKDLQANRKKYLYLAERNLLGWNKIVRDNKTGYNHWQYYRPPAVCVKAMAWISVLEGAKMFSLWNYQLYSKKELQRTSYEASAFGPPSHLLIFSTLAGRSGKPTAHLKAYAQATKEIMPYSKIIMNMDKLKGSPLYTKTKNMFMRAYRYRDIDGYVVVVYNNFIGTCPGNKNIYQTANTTLKIDNQANIVGFITEKKSREVIMQKTLPLKDYSLFDLSSGKKISLIDNKYNQEIMPGSGKLFFLGTTENANKLHAMIVK